MLGPVSLGAGGATSPGEDPARHGASRCGQHPRSPPDSRSCRKPRGETQTPRLATSTTNPPATASPSRLLRRRAAISRSSFGAWKYRWLQLLGSVRRHPGKAAERGSPAQHRTSPQPRRRPLISA